MGDGEAIVALAFAVVIIMIGLAVVEFIRSADSIALMDGNKALYASRAQAAWQ